jgi:hypothetical protein
MESWNGTYFSKEFHENVKELEKMLGREVWLLLEGNYSPSVMHPFVFNNFKASKTSLAPGKPVAIMLDSAGGFADAAYGLATFLRRRCGKFTAVVPRIAKSAATLFALGADEIILGEEAHLGPLDVQFKDYDVEERMVSALDTVHAVDQLEQSAIEVGMKMLVTLGKRTKKKYNVLIEPALHFAAEITKPLFDKIDSVRYSRQFRLLREAQDYAERLLQPKFKENVAKAIAKELVRNYPTHDFMIDRAEALKLGVVEQEDEESREARPAGLHVRRKLTTELEQLLDWFAGELPTLCGVGKLEPI